MDNEKLKNSNTDRLVTMDSLSTVLGSETSAFVEYMRDLIHKRRLVEPRVFILEGGGANGRSTFFNALAYVLGADSTHTFIEAFDYRIKPQKVAGKTAVFFHEPPTNYSFLNDALRHGASTVFVVSYGSEETKEITSTLKYAVTCVKCPYRFVLHENMSGESNELLRNIEALDEMKVAVQAALSVSS